MEVLYKYVSIAGNCRKKRRTKWGQELSQRTQFVLPESGYDAKDIARNIFIYEGAPSNAFELLPCGNKYKNESCKDSDPRQMFSRHASHGRPWAAKQVNCSSVQSSSSAQPEICENSRNMPYDAF